MKIAAFMKKIPFFGKNLKESYSCSLIKQFGLPNNLFFLCKKDSFIEIKNSD